MNLFVPLRTSLCWQRRGRFSLDTILLNNLRFASRRHSLSSRSHDKTAHPATKINNLPCPTCSTTLAQSRSLCVTPTFGSDVSNIEGSLIKKTLRWMGFGKYKYSKMRLKRSGLFIYMCVDEFVDFPHMMKSLQLADTFYSYYLIAELHVWMVMSRLTQEGEDGKLVKQALVSAFWDYMDEKSKKLGKAAMTSARRENIAQMGSHFNAAMFAYDEGLLGDDKTLAGAVWRTLFHRGDVDVALVEKVVAYIRKQMAYLDTQDSTVLLRNGIVYLMSLDSDQHSELHMDHKKLLERFKS